MRTLSTLAEIMDLVMNLINWTHNFCEMRKYVFNIFLEYNIITRKTLPFRCHHKYFLLAIILPPKKKKKLLHHENAKMNHGFIFIYIL